jgi:hypothetical protein
MREPLGDLMPRITTAITKAVPFVMAAFLLLAPSMLTAQVPTSGASKADSAVSQDQDAAKTNESAEIAQKLTNPLAAMICVLSTRKFAIGPTAVALKHKDHTNVGLLASHVWSVVGSDSHPDVSETYAQPFVAYTTTKAYAATSYDTYNWNSRSLDGDRESHQGIQAREVGSATAQRRRGASLYRDVSAKPAEGLRS